MGLGEVGGGDGDEGGSGVFVEQRVEGGGGDVGGEEEEAATGHHCGGGRLEERFHSREEGGGGEDIVRVGDGDGLGAVGVEELGHPVVGARGVVVENEGDFGKEADVAAGHLDVEGLSGMRGGERKDS